MKIKDYTKHPAWTVKGSSPTPVGSIVEFYDGSGIGKTRYGTRVSGGSSDPNEILVQLRDHRTIAVKMNPEQNKKWYEK